MLNEIGFILQLKVVRFVLGMFGYFCRVTPGQKEECTLQMQVLFQYISSTDFD